MDGMIAYGGGDYKVRIWYWENWIDQQTSPIILGSHDLSIARVKFSPSGKMLASCSGDGLVKIWLLDSPLKPLVVIQADTQAIYSLEFSSNELLLASAGKDRTIKIWNLSELQSLYKTSQKPITPEQAKPTILQGHTSDVNRIEFLYSTKTPPNPDNDRFIVSGSDDGTIRVWEVQTSNPSRSKLNLNDVLKYSCSLIQNYESDVMRNQITTFCP